MDAGEVFNMRLNPIIAVLMATTIWSLTGAWIHWAKISTFTLAFFRTSIPLIATAIYMIQKKISFKSGHQKWLLLSSLLNFLCIIFYLHGFVLSNIGHAIILLYTWPVMVILISLFLKKESLNFQNIVYILMSFLGVFILKEDISGSENIWGMLSMLACAFFTAVDLLIMKYVIKDCPLSSLIFYQNLIGCLILLPFVFYLPNLYHLPTAGMSIGYAILVGIISYLLFYSALEKMETSKISNLSYTELLFTALLGIFFFKEPFTIKTLMGGTLIIMTTILVLLKQKNIVSTPEMSHVIQKPEGRFKKKFATAYCSQRKISQRQKKSSNL